MTDNATQRANWFMAWINCMAYFIIACCATGITATVLLLAGHSTAAFAVGQPGMVLFGGLGLWFDYRRLTRG